MGKEVGGVGIGGQIGRGGGVDPRTARLERQWECKQRDERQVLDLTSRGKPVERPARLDEGDGDGNLLSRRVPVQGYGRQPARRSWSAAKRPMKLRSWPGLASSAVTTSALQCACPLSP